MRTGRLVPLLAVLAAAPLALAGCKSGGGGTASAAGGDVGDSDTRASQSFDAFDLEGTWRGTSVPFNPWDLPLELTLGFDAFGPGNNQVTLDRYTFPGITHSGTVDYLELIDSYTLFFFENGRLTLDTYLLFIDQRGNTVEEYVFKSLFMNPERTELQGGETIEVYTNGHLTTLVDGWLTMQRLEPGAD